MPTFTIIAVGRLKESYFVAAAEEYVKRIGGYAKINLIDVKDGADKDTASAIIAKIPQGAYVCALCIEGRKLSSEAFSDSLSQVYHSSKKGICFVIGGSQGLSDEVKAIADMKLSMSDMTFPHRLAKIMLLEQLYRALSIQNNGKYHK
ncbi:MAG: 23S rRNA (pseudouridine(1915)-N(3))-methyltransferase RlmH [Oscillospiraceae bacterium]|nr:23S rRNA (pseudouridine(1915)-N(3))-methyltransferase RlmH [Oscillospiraceae bacterium]